jgi:hypothetical protein
MANPIAFNNGNTPTGSVKRSTISIGVSGEDYSNLGGLTWFNGIEPNGKYIIYSDTYSQGSSTIGNAKPTAWGTTDGTDASLLALINALPARQGQPLFGTLSSAVDWLYGTGQYVIISDDFPYILTDGLKLGIDSETVSYPRAGVTWYDFSGNSNHFTLYNSPVFNSNGWISLDGTDDRIQLASSTSLTLGTGNFTLDIWVYPTTLSTYNHFFVLGNNMNGDSDGFTFKAGNTSDGNGRIYMYAVNGAASFSTFETWSTITSAVLTLNVWNNLTLTNNGGTVTIYKNGVSAGSKSGLIANFANKKWSIGNPPSGGEYAAKNVASAKIYNRALSATEIKQNYYGAGIVTNGLTFNFDSGSFGGYPRSGTLVNDMAGGISGTLTNGPIFSAQNQNSLYFDGSDDYAEWGRCTATEFQYYDSFTIEVWYKPTGQGNYVFTNRKNSGLNYSGWAIYQNSSGYLQCWIGGYPNNAFGWKRVFAYTQNNTWVHVVYVNTPAAGSQTVYINGVKAGFNANEDAAYQNSYIDYTATPYHAPVIGTSPADNYTQNSSFNIAVARVYNTALTEAQANQNFNAQRMRFGL